MDTARHGWTRWFLWLVALGIAVWLVARLVAPAPVVAPAPSAATTPPPAPTAPADPLVVAGVDVGASASGALASIATSFSGITDADTAQAALPHLIEARNQLADLEGPVSSLSEQGRSSLRDMVAATMPGLRDGAERLKTDGPISAVVSPVVDDILAQLSAYSA